MGEKANILFRDIFFLLYLATEVTIQIDRKHELINVDHNLIKDLVRLLVENRTRREETSRLWTRNKSNKSEKETKQPIIKKMTLRKCVCVKDRKR